MRGSVDHSWLQHNLARGDNHPRQGVVGRSCGKVEHAPVDLILALLASGLGALRGQHGHGGQAERGRREAARQQGRFGQAERRAAEGQNGRPAEPSRRAQVQGAGRHGERAPQPLQTLQPVAAQESSRRPRNDDVGAVDVSQLGFFSRPRLHQGAHPAGTSRFLRHEVPVGLDVLPQGTGISVAFQAAHHLAVVGLVHVVGTGVLEAVAGVGVALVAALVGADVGLLS